MSAPTWEVRQGDALALLRDLPCTYNPLMNRTWCLCGEVVVDGNQVTVPHVACCGGPLTEPIPEAGR